MLVKLFFKRNNRRKHIYAMVDFFLTKKKWVDFSVTNLKLKFQREWYVPMAKKQSIPTIRKIFSINDGREFASMHLDGKRWNTEKKHAYIVENEAKKKNYLQRMNMQRQCNEKKNNVFKRKMQK